MGNNKNELPYRLVGPIKEAVSVTLECLYPEEEAALISQGAKITRDEKAWNDVILVEYPNGSKRQELLGRAQECRLVVTFPNGFKVLEIENRKGECVALYIHTPPE